MTLEAEVAYLHLINGIRQPEVPAGFAVRTAPRKAARGRDRDVLMIALSLSPGAPGELIELTANTFFGTPGSVTAAARAALAAVSARLYDHNRYPPPAGPVSGGLCCAILRGSDLYVALSGAGNAIIVHPNAVERFPDPGGERTRPIGLAPSADVQYFHTVVAESDFVLLTAAVPSGWEADTIAHLAGSGLESGVARLTRLAGAHAAALVARFAAEGAAPAKHRPAITAAPLTPATAAHADSATPTPPPVAEPPAPTLEPEPQPAPDTSSLAGIIARVRASPVMGELTEEEAESAATLINAEPESAASPPVAPPPATPATLREASDPAEEVHIGDHVYEFEEEEPEEESAEGESRSFMQRLQDGAKQWFANLPLGRANEAMRGGQEALGSSLRSSGASALRRLLPEGVIRPESPARLVGRESRLQIPDRLLIAIAILLPIVIALAVGWVYVQRGRAQQYRDYMDQARLEAGLARTQPDPLSAKPHWVTALAWLDQAESIFPGQETAAALRAEAQSAVDAVDGIQRLPLEPLTPGGFGASANIAEVVVNGSEVYALDSTRQSVYRAVLTEDGKFVIDRTFQCEAGVVGTFAVNNIVDIVWLNTPNVVNKPALMAMDDDGILMYCKTDGAAPEASQLIAPDIGWKTPKAIEIYADRLYVFDPGLNDLWQYDRVGGSFSERPKSYFTGTVFDLSAAAGFTISQGEVYILRGDGRLIYCVRDPNTLQPGCIENVLYSDSRAGHFSGERLDDALAPIQLFYDPPPEPSLYLLDSASSGVYQLSLKLVLQRQWRSSQPLPAPIAAIAIGPNKELFVASGNNVYWSRR
ncbi:MAG: hypothetical protein FJ030_02180 [Chloroflexi bacterium]|nr:hypothetical protein [Chloroflexota bacterium]